MSYVDGLSVRKVSGLDMVYIAICTMSRPDTSSRHSREGGESRKDDLDSPLRGNGVYVALILPSSSISCYPVKYLFQRISDRLLWVFSPYNGEPP
jgi:hypothetical protein